MCSRQHGNGKKRIAKIAEWHEWVAPLALRPQRAVNYPLHRAPPPPAGRLLWQIRIQIVSRAACSLKVPFLQRLINSAFFLVNDLLKCLKVAHATLTAIVLSEVARQVVSSPGHQHSRRRGDSGQVGVEGEALPPIIPDELPIGLCRFCERMFGVSALDYLLADGRIPFPQHTPAHLNGAPFARGTAKHSLQTRTIEAFG